MKRISLPVFFLLVVSAVNGQVTKTSTVPVNPLKTTLDSVNYVLGEIAAYHLKQQGLNEVKINGAAFLRGLTDILDAKKTLMDDAMANTTIMRYLEIQKTAKVKPTIEEGQKFLAQNKLKPGVKTTASGLQYEILQEGTGIKPAAVDTFVAHYRGTLLNGTEFDASYNRGQPLTLGVSQVIKGWTEGLQLMPVGSKYKFYIPYNLAYGAMGQGQIPGGAMLIFEVELLDVKKKQP